MDKEFSEWWELHKHDLFYSNMGILEIAEEAYKAGRESAQQKMQPTNGGQSASDELSKPTTISG